MTTSTPPTDSNRFRLIARELYPEARVVPVRGLRRVIRRWRDLDEFGSRAPHDLCLAIPLSQLRQHLSPTELGITTADEAPQLLLIPAPDPEADWHTELRRLWRVLFHAAIDRRFEELVAQGELPRDRVEHYIAKWGPSQWAEIRAVLAEEYRIGDDDSPTIFREFVAFFLELCQFEPHDIHAYFPGLKEHDVVLEWVLQHFDAAQIAEQYRPAEIMSSYHDEVAATTPPTIPNVSSTTITRHAEQIAQQGNDVRVAVMLLQAGDPAYREAARRLHERLQALFPAPASTSWATVLEPLLTYMADGIWPIERRILYELQKACLDLERDIYAVDLIGWLRSFGRQRIKRPLTKPRWLYATRHLRVADRLVDRSRLTVAEQERLRSLLESVVATVEERARTELRPELVAGLNEAGLQPTTLAEQISRDKAVEELLDVAAERGMIRIGDLRDAIARGRVKLPDLQGPIEFLRGDPLIRANRILATRLDGVYRRGEIYMRWLQRGCSLFFGTKAGRVFTKYMALPLGGAYVAIEAFNHAVEAVEGAVHWLDGTSAMHKAFGAVAGAPATHVAMYPEGLSSGINFTALSVVTVFIFMMLHWSAFRQYTIHTLQFLCFKLPRAVIHSPVWRIVFGHPLMRFVKRHLLIPIGTGLATHLFVRLAGESSVVAWYASGAVAILFAILAHTAFGRGIEDRMNEAVERMWKIISVNFIMGLFTLVLQFFQSVLEAIDRLIYAVDEWLRFRSGENRLAFVFKLLFGSLWHIVTYVFRFAWNLLVEPQINPIKHFPVVTVSHKMLLPLISTLAKQFAVSIETMTTIVFGIPGIFGFIVWELKENWKLYRANAAPTLRPLVIGSHGERMRALLRPGFHSGVVPKTFAKWRKALRTGHTRRANKQHHHLHHIAEGLHRFIEREIVALLVHSPRWAGLPIQADDPSLSLNRVRFALRFANQANPFVVMIEERHGWIIGSVEELGGLALLTTKQRNALATAIIGLYQFAGVHVIREHLASVLGRPAYQFDAVPEGLLIQYEGKVHLFDYEDGPELIAPTMRLPTTTTVFSECLLDWSAWSAYWEATEPPQLMPEWVVLPSATTSEL